MAMGTRDLTEHVRARLVELHRAKKFTQTAVARRLNKDTSAANRILTGTKAITLADLEAIADEADVNAAELIAPPGTLKQLNAEEAELLRMLRAWPQSVRLALLVFLRFFADESPAETQTRNLHEHWRGLNAGDRNWIAGVVQMVREGILPPDLREGLIDQLITETQKRRAADAKRRPRREEEA
jgi:transcriptional regulator with XRE-family HTH domain